MPRYGYIQPPEIDIGRDVAGALDTVYGFQRLQDAQRQSKVDQAKEIEGRAINRIMAGPEPDEQKVSILRQRGNWREADELEKRLQTRQRDDSTDAFTEFKRGFEALDLEYRDSQRRLAEGSRIADVIASTPEEHRPAAWQRNLDTLRKISQGGPLDGLIPDVYDPEFFSAAAPELKTAERLVSDRAKIISEGNEKIKAAKDTYDTDTALLEGFAKWNIDSPDDYKSVTEFVKPLLSPGAQALLPEWGPDFVDQYAKLQTRFGVGPKAEEPGKDVESLVQAVMQNPTTVWSGIPPTERAAVLPGLMARGFDLSQLSAEPLTPSEEASILAKANDRKDTLRRESRNPDSPLYVGKDPSKASPMAQGRLAAEIARIDQETKILLDLHRGRAPGGQRTGSTPGTVRMVSPDGSESIDVPRDQVEHYRSLGATIATPRSGR